MSETPERLLQRIQLGEDSRLGLKVLVFSGRKMKGPSRDVIADELAAFANSRGGTIVFGVDDESRQVVGIPTDLLDDVQDLIIETCKDTIRPSLPVATRKMLLPGADGADRAVLCVDVDRSVFVHESPAGYLHRVGSSKRRMEPDHLARLFQQRAESRVLRFDEQVIANAEIGDLDGALVDRFQAERSKDERAVLLRKLAMAAEDEGKLKPTVAGVLLGSRRPETWLPNAFIQAVAYRGDDILDVAEGDDAGRRGEGIAIIENRTRRLARRPPTWTLADGTELIVTIPAARAADHWNAG